MNRNFLCLPEVIGEVIHEYREENPMVSYIVRSGQSKISNFNINTPTYDVKFSALHVRQIDMNFSTGAAVSMLESIVAHLDIMSAQDIIVNNIVHGSTFKQHIQNDK